MITTKRYMVHDSRPMYSAPQLEAGDLGKIWNGVIAGLERMAPPQRQVAIDALLHELGEEGWWENPIAGKTPNAPTLPGERATKDRRNELPQSTQGRATQIAEDLFSRQRKPVSNAQINEQNRNYWNTRS